MPADHQQLLGDEGGGQAVLVPTGEGRTVASGVDHQHVRVFLAQPQEELLQQFFVAAHGDAGAHQRIDLVAFDVARANAVDAPAPVEDAYAVFHQVHRCGDVGGDAGVRVALDDDFEALAGLVQPAQETGVAALVPVRGENPGHGAAVVVRLVGITRIDAGARFAIGAGAEVIGEVGRIEIDIALDHADADRFGLYGRLARRDASLVIVHRIHEAVRRPLFGVLFRFACWLARGFALFAALRCAFFHHHGIDAGFVADAQHQRIALGQVLHRQAQLVDVQRWDGADHLGVVFLRQAPGLVEAVVAFLDQQADQVDIGGQAIHVLRHFIRAGSEHMAAMQRQPHRIAGARAVLQPQRCAAMFVAVQL